MPALSATLILTAVMPVALLLATGFLLRKSGVMDEGLRPGLMKLVLWVFFPALVLDKVTQNPALKDDAVAFWSPAAGFASLIVGYAVSRVFSGLCGADTPERRRAFVYTTGNYNYGYLAIPVCETLYGRESVAVLLLYNIGLELCLWSVGMVVLTGELNRDSWKRVFNPISVAMLAALALNRTDAAAHLPAWFYRTVGMLGACSIPCGLLLVGMGIPALLDGFRARHDARITTGSILLRNGLIPAIFVAGGLFLPLPPEVSRLLVLQAAMPAALLPIVMCQHYGVAPQVSLRVAVATTLAGAVTLPAWLWIGQWLQSRAG
jgi:malate permease and related proteins